MSARLRLVERWALPVRGTMVEKIKNLSFIKKSKRTANLRHFFVFEIALDVSRDVREMLIILSH